MLLPPFNSLLFSESSSLVLKHQHNFNWPSTEDFLRIISLRDYNTRIVLLGTMFFGFASGMIGVFVTLRKRALIGDAVSHASLPGVVVAFIFMVSIGGTGKFLPGVLVGALISSFLGVGVIILVRNYTRLNEDAALGLVLSVFFGFGVALLGITQKMKGGNSAGLESFIYGKTASMLISDAWLILIAALVVLFLSVIFFKEFTILCFDEEYTLARGWSVFTLDLMMMFLTVVVTVIGLQAVGLILVVALLIIPPISGRFWTSNLKKMFIISSSLGALSGLLGGAVSALAPKLPAGALIVLVCGFFFLISFLFGFESGIFVKLFRNLRFQYRILIQNLLRSMYEIANTKSSLKEEEAWSILIRYEELFNFRNWKKFSFRIAVELSKVKNLIVKTKEGLIFTKSGYLESARIFRNHNLWELYLLNYAGVGLGHVDHFVDDIEHIVESKILEELEAEQKS